MATTIRELLVRLGVKADAAAAKSFDERIGRVKQTMVAAFAATTALGYGLFKLAKATSAAGDDAATAAARVGISTEAYQEMQYVANRADMSVEELTASLRRQARVVQEAASGTKTAVDTFRELGLSADDPRLKDQATALEVLVTAMRGIKEEGKRVALSQELWGRGGTALLPLIQDETLSIEALRKEAHKLGYIMDAEAIAASQQFDDTLKDAQLTLMGFRNTIGLAVMPVFNDLITRTREYALVNREVIKAKVEDWADRFSKAVIWLTDHFEQLVTVGEVFAALWVGGKLASGILTAIGLVKDLRVAVVALAAALGVGVLPLAAIVAGVSAVIAGYVALGLVIEDLIVYFRGGDSAIGAWIDAHKEQVGVVGSLARLVEALMDALRALGTYVATELQPVLDVLSQTFDIIATGAAKALDKVSGFLGKQATDYLERQTGYVRGITGAIQGATAPSLPAVAAQGSGGISSSRTFQGGALSISGAGISASEAERLGRALMAEQARQSAAVFQGGEL